MAPKALGSSPMDDTQSFASLAYCRVDIWSGSWNQPSHSSVFNPALERLSRSLGYFKLNWMFRLTLEARFLETIYWRGFFIAGPSLRAIANFFSMNSVNSVPRQRLWSRLDYLSNGEFLVHHYPSGVNDETENGTASGWC